jgi:hypothetical protein
MKSSEEGLRQGTKPSEPLNISNAGNVMKWGWKEHAPLWEIPFCDRNVPQTVPEK